MKTEEEQQLLEDYFNLELDFEELYKYRASYINREIGFRVTGTIDYRDTITPKDRLHNICELEDIVFEWLDKKK